MLPDLAEEAAVVVKTRLPKTPQVAIILGSGLSAFAHTLADPLVVPYGDIPHFPELTVPGHVGELVYGVTAGLPVVVARGRFHYYEGHPLETVTLPVRLFARLGVSQLIITNAAGCVNTDWNVGDLMLLTGHLDYTFIDGLATPEVRDGAFHSPELWWCCQRVVGSSWSYLSAYST